MTRAEASADHVHGDDHDDQHTVIKSHRWAVLFLVQISTLVFGMAITATTVVLPHIRGALSVNQDQASWIVTLFLVAAAVATPMTGWLAGKFGWRRFMVTALVGFTLSSIACGLAESLEILLLARVAQGLFGAPLMPLGQGMLLATFPRHMHPLVLMMWGVGAVMGPVLGPILGGVIAESLNWRWAFLIMAPIGVLCIGVAVFALGDQERGTSGRLGTFGFIGLAVSMGAAQLMLDRGHRLDWFESNEIILEAVLTVVGLVTFVTHTAYARVPFLNRRLFTDWNFAFGLVMVFIMGCLSYTPITLFPTLLQDLRHYPDDVVGYLISSRGMGNFCSFLIVVQFTRFNPRLALTVGLLLQVWAGWEMTRLDINLTNFDVFWTNFVQGFGFGLAYTPMTVLAFATLPTHLSVQAAAVFNLMRNFGSSLFISLSILVFLRSTAENYAGLSAVVNPLNEALRDPAVAGQWALDSSEGLAALSAEIQRQASMGGYLNAFELFTLVAVLSLPFAWMFRSVKRKAPA